MQYLLVYTYINKLNNFLLPKKLKFNVNNFELIVSNTIMISGFNVIYYKNNTNNDENT